MLKNNTRALLSFMKTVNWTSSSKISSMAKNKTSAACLEFQEQQRAHLLLLLAVFMPRMHIFLLRSRSFFFFIFKVEYKPLSAAHICMWTQLATSKKLKKKILKIKFPKTKNHPLRDGMEKHHKRDSSPKTTITKLGRQSTQDPLRKAFVSK